MSIAELRKKEIDNLVYFKSKEPTAGDYENARRLMCSYYRLCGLSRRNLYRANDERLCNLSSTARYEYQEQRWHERLRNEFKKLFGLDLVYTSYYPRIGIKDERGGFREVIYTHFY